jgi:hypothetical protein
MTSIPPNIPVKRSCPNETAQQDLKKQKLEDSKENIENRIQSISPAIKINSDYSKDQNNFLGLSNRAHSSFIHEIKNLKEQDEENFQNRLLKEFNKYQNYEGWYITELLHTLVIKNKKIFKIFNNELKEKSIELLKKLPEKIIFKELHQLALRQLLIDLLTLKTELNLDLPLELNIFIHDLLIYISKKNMLNKSIINNELLKNYLSKITINDDNIHEILKFPSKCVECLDYIKKDYPEIILIYNHYIENDRLNFIQDYHEILIILINTDIEINYLKKFVNYLEIKNINYSINLNPPPSFNNLKSLENYDKIIDAFQDRILFFHFLDIDESDDEMKLEMENINEMQIQNNYINASHKPKELALNALLEKCVNLKDLYLSSKNFKNLSSLKNLVNLYGINFEKCSNFEKFSFLNFNEFKNLNYISLNKCNSLSAFPKIDVNNFKYINLKNCDLLTDAQKFEKVNQCSKYFTHINVSGCSLKLKKHIYTLRDAEQAKLEDLNSYSIELVCDGIINQMIDVENQLIRICKNNPSLKIHDIMYMCSQSKNPLNKLIAIELIVLSNKDNLNIIVEVLTELCNSDSLNHNLAFNEIIVSNIFPLLRLTNPLDEWNEHPAFQWRKPQIIAALDLLINLREGNEYNPSFNEMEEILIRSIELIAIKKEEFPKNAVEGSIESINELMHFLQSKDGKEIVTELVDSIAAYSPKLYQLIIGLYPDLGISNKLIYNYLNHKNEVFPRLFK